MTPRSTSRVDLHCHSTASAVSRLGVQRALGLPECATPPQEVYELATRRRTDFVTIADHDTLSRQTLLLRSGTRGRADRLRAARARPRPSMTLAA